MGMTFIPVCHFLTGGLSYRRRFPVVYLTFKAMRRPQCISKQHEVCAFYVTYCTFPHDRWLQIKSTIGKLKYTN